MYILAIDQGTTSTRVVLYNTSLDIIAISQKSLEQIYPQNGYLEHNPEQIFEDIIELIKACIDKAVTKLQLTSKRLLESISSVGLTNQRETTVIWDKTSGKPVHNAIVWQDRRTAEFCNKLKNKSPGLEKEIIAKTGLVIDPYFSASKIHWLLHQYNLHNNSNILTGTIDSYIIWKLTAGKIHATDITNASRTQLFNIVNLNWDKDLLELYNIPGNILPDVYDCDANFGKIDKKYFGHEIPIAGVAGDQQAAAIGQYCFKPKQCKITYGTGSFILQNTGGTKVVSQNKLISTIAFKINNQLSYALEGSIFIAGAAVQWLRDSLNFIENAKDTEQISMSLDNNNGVYLVPAFTGLGAPYWDPEARGAILGLTRDTGIEHIVRAALESVCYQTNDLLSAFKNDYNLPSTIKVDGGMTENNWLLQFLADITRFTIVRPYDRESTVRGAAILAGLGQGLYKDLTSIPREKESSTIFNPKMNTDTRDKYHQGWLNAIDKIVSN